MGPSGLKKGISGTAVQLIERAGGGNEHKVENMKLVLGNPADSDLRECLGL